MSYKLILILLGALLLSACMSNNIYYWGSYESTLYSYNKDPNESNLATHKAQLEKIINKAENSKKRVPPGIYFELGMIEAKLGNIERSIALLNREKSKFPEAQLYVDNAIASLEANS